MTDQTRIKERLDGSCRIVAILLAALIGVGVVMSAFMFSLGEGSLGVFFGLGVAFCAALMVLIHPDYRETWLKTDDSYHSLEWLGLMIGLIATLGFAPFTYVTSIDAEAQDNLLRHMLGISGVGFAVILLGMYLRKRGQSKRGRSRRLRQLFAVLLAFSLLAAA